MDKHELAASLRSRRERLRPQDVGVPAGPRRRTPADLVDQLRHGSEHFARLWERHDVQPVSMLTKTFSHPTIGAVTVDCDVLHLAEQDQTLVLYSAPNGSEAADALRFLGAISAAEV